MNALLENLTWRCHLRETTTRCAFNDPFSMQETGTSTAPLEM
jgi:hypothetical protein